MSIRSTRIALFVAWTLSTFAYNDVKAAGSQIVLDFATGTLDTSALQEDRMLWKISLKGDNLKSYIKVDLENHLNTAIWIHSDDAKLRDEIENHVASKNVVAAIEKLQTRYQEKDRIIETIKKVESSGRSAAATLLIALPPSRFSKTFYELIFGFEKGHVYYQMSIAAALTMSEHYKQANPTFLTTPQ